MNNKAFEIEFQKIMNELGLKHKNINLYYEAFTHPSYANEHNLNFNYERIEFLGDTILDFLVSEYLYENYQLKEGDMSKIRAAYVCEQANANYTEKMHLHNCFLVGKGAKQQKEDTKLSVLGNLFESFLGAVYLDQGLDVVRSVLAKVVYPEIKYEKKIFFIDYKSKLQEFIQADSRNSVFYELEKETGMPHDKTFEIVVKHEGAKLGRGIGKTKKEAEQNAAQDALSKLAII